jgi:MFS family permease
VAGTLSRARAALASRDFRFLLSGRLASQCSDGIFQAFLIDRLVFLAPDSQSTAMGIAKASALLVIPYSVVGPLAGVFVDRWSRRRILVRTPLVRAAAAIALIATLHTNAWLYGLALLMVSLNRFYLTTAGAVMPSLVPDEDLLVANSMAAATGTVVTFLGLLAGTQLATSVGSAGLLGATAVGWLAAAALVAVVRNPLTTAISGVPVSEELRHAAADLWAGARRLAATPAAFGGVVSVSVDQVLFGVVTALSIVVFKRQFNGGIASYGRILGAGGLGVIVGTLTVGSFEPHVDKPRIVALAFALGGVACLLASASITAATVLIVSLVLGVVYPWKKVPVDTIVQEETPDRFRGRVFALYDVGFAAARVLGAFVTAVAIQHTTAPVLLATVGAVYLLWTPVLPVWARRRPVAGVRFHAGGRADETPREIVIGGQAEAVQMIGSWEEERSGVRVRRFRLQSADAVMDVVGGGGERWTLERQVWRTPPS